MIQLYFAVLDPNLERLNGLECGEGLRSPGAEVEQRTVPGTLHCTGGRVELRTGRPKTLPAFLPVETFEARIENGEVKLAH